MGQFRQWIEPGHDRDPLCALPDALALGRAGGQQRGASDDEGGGPSEGKHRLRTTLNLYPFGEAFHHGEVALAQNRVKVQLRVGEGVFSAASVDVGSRLLLRTLATAEHAAR